MLKNFLLLFLALRAADILNLVGGLFLVPNFVDSEDLGAILPLTTFTTAVSIPMFAIAMTALRESARLRSLRDGIPDRGGRLQSSAESDRQLRSFVRGVFAAVGVTSVLTLAVTAAVLPRTLERLRISDSLSGSFAVAAAFLGCVSPVYLDQLQAAKRFGAVGILEVSAAALRLAVMAALMPFRALAGFFAGGVAKTLVQILGPFVVLRRGGGLPASANQDDTQSYWTRDNLIHLTKTFALLLPYLALPMFVSMTENDLVRTRLSSDDSAGYYMVTRISDLMNYFTYPILFVMFPYVTDRSSRGESCLKIVLRSCGVIFFTALVALPVTTFFGGSIVSMLPNGDAYTAYAADLPLLILLMTFGAAQNIVTNALVAAGRFEFLLWFVPLNLIYMIALPRFAGENPSLGFLVSAFSLFALTRCLFALAQLGFASPRVSGN